MCKDCGIQDHLESWDPDLLKVRWLADASGDP